MQHVFLAVAAEEMQLRGERLAQELVLDHSQPRNPQGTSRYLQSQSWHAAEDVGLVQTLDEARNLVQVVPLYIQGKGVE